MIRRRRLPAAYLGVAIVTTLVLTGMGYAIIQARHAAAAAEASAAEARTLGDENKERIRENETARRYLCRRRARLAGELARSSTLDLAAIAERLNVPLALVLAGRRDDERELAGLRREVKCPV